MSLGEIAKANDSESHSGFWPRVVAQLLDDGKITEDDVRVAMGRVNAMNDREYEETERRHKIEDLGA